MASYSSAIKENDIGNEYTLRKYFEDEKIKPKHQKIILEKIDKTVKDLKLNKVNSDQKTQTTIKSKLFTYCRKSIYKTSTPILFENKNFYFPLKFRFKSKVMKLFTTKITKSGRFGGQKKVVPTVVFKPNTDLLDMTIIGLAIVVINKKDEKITPKIKVEILNEELNTFRSLQGPNTVKLFDTFNYIGKGDDPRFCMLMEWCPNSLTSKMQNKEHPLTDLQKYKYTQSLIEILENLSENNIYYRDLKPDNLLVDKDDNLKIADFGLAVPLKKSMNSKCGTKTYHAPEFLHGHALIAQAKADARKAVSQEEKVAAKALYKKGVTMGATLKGDVWTAGLVLYELFYGHHPFLSKSGSHADEFGVSEGDLFESRLLHYPDNVQRKLDEIFNDNPAPNTLRGMLKSMLQLDPEKRPTPGELKATMAEIMKTIQPDLLPASTEPSSSNS